MQALWITSYPYVMLCVSPAVLSLPLPFLCHLNMSEEPLLALTLPAEVVFNVNPMWTSVGKCRNHFMPTSNPGDEHDPSYSLSFLFMFPDRIFP